MDLEALRLAIETSFRSTGTDRAWLAEDIALSIESSLRSFGDGCVLTLGEIDAIVVNILRETGFPAAALDYRESRGVGTRGIPVRMDRVASLVSGSGVFVLGADASDIAASVVDACQVLSIDEAPIPLILELARFYAASPRFEASGRCGTSSLCSPPRFSDPWLVEKRAILGVLGVGSSELVESGMLSLYGVSQIFPSIRIGVDFAEIARRSGFAPPVAEIALYPVLAHVGDAVAEVAISARRLVGDASSGKVSDGDVPVRLRALDAPGFAGGWLCGSWPESQGCVMELLSEVGRCVDGEIFLDPR